MGVLDMRGMRSIGQATVFVALAACGRMNFDVRDDGGAPEDDGLALPRCTSGTFGAPVPVTGLGVSPPLFRPNLTEDGGRLYFAQLGSSEDLFVARRVSTTTFEAATPLASVNTSDPEGTPFVSLDEKTLAFWTNRPGSTGSRDLWLATREDPGDAFTVVRELTELNTSGIEHTPSMTRDGLAIYFGSDRGGMGDEDIYVATRSTPSSTFGPPSEVTELSTIEYDSAPFISPDGLSLYFASGRPGGLGCNDLYVATRASTADPFSPPQPIPEINSPQCEDDPTISADGCEIWFVSDRTGPVEIYRASRSE